MSKQNAGKRGTRLLYVQLFLLCLRVTSVLGSMNDAPWACSVHCADSGRCGDGGFYNYLLPEPCSTKVDSELSHSAGCDFRVCKEVCSSLQASKQNVAVEGNIYNCYKSSERSFDSLEVASDATVAFGCGFSGHAHGGTFLFGKGDKTVEILVMNLAFQDLVGTPHQELERKTSVMVDVRTRLVLENIRIRKSTYVPLYTDTKFVNRIKR